MILKHAMAFFFEKKYNMYSLVAISGYTLDDNKWLFLLQENVARRTPSLHHGFEEKQGSSLMKSICICLCAIKTLKDSRMFNSMSEDAEPSKKTYSVNDEYWTIKK